MRDRGVGAIVCSLGVLMLVATRRLPPAMLGDPAGPTLLPLMLAWSLVGLGALLALRAPRDQAVGPIWGGGLPLAAVVALLVVYAVAFTTLGYLVATAAMLFLLLAVYNPRRARLNAIVAIAFSVLTYVLFHQLLGVYVPPGLVG